MADTSKDPKETWTSHGEVLLNTKEEDAQPIASLIPGVVADGDRPPDSSAATE